MKHCQLVYRLRVRRLLVHRGRGKMYNKRAIGVVTVVAGVCLAATPLRAIAAEKESNSSAELSSVIETGRLTDDMAYALNWGEVTREEATACQNTTVIGSDLALPMGYTCPLRTVSGSELALARFAQVFVTPPVGSSFAGATLGALVFVALAIGGTYAALKQGLIH